MLSLETLPMNSLLLFISLSLSSTICILCNGAAVTKDTITGFLELPEVVGPESLEFDCHGEGPYAGASDGRILKWNTARRVWTEFAVTSPNRDRKACDGSRDPIKEKNCGRPLGLKFDTKTCNLYIADAYFGLQVVGPRGGIARQLAMSADDGIPFKFVNDLDVDTQTGVVYFTDSSRIYERWTWPLIILTGDKTGRLLKYDPSTKKVQVLIKDLAFSNGVALSKDGSFLLLAESSRKTIHKLWLKGPKANTKEIFVQLNRTPDNIKRNQDGYFWVALNSGRRILKESLGNEFAKMPLKNSDTVGVKIDDNGNIIEVLDGRYGEALDSVSEVKEHNGFLWIGSAVKPYVGIVTT